MTLTRRSLLAAGLALPLTTTGSRKPRFTLPRPTGPYPVGIVSPRIGELWTSVWYPAAPGPRHLPRALWMPDAALQALLAAYDFVPDSAAPAFTAGHEGAPALPGRHPVTLFSHGANGHREEATVVVQELASHGYVVVTVDHSYDAFGETPDGRLYVPDDNRSVTPWDHARDILFVLDHLEDAGLPVGVDLRRTGMFGFSKGATATALVMNEDHRVRAGLSFDGPMESGPRPAGLDRPFMLMTAEFSRDAAEAVEEFWSKLRGWRLNVRAEGGLHGAYCDHEWLLPQLGSFTEMTAEELTGWIGTLDPARAIRIQQAYPLAFFDQHLRGVKSRLIEGPSRAFPEVKFIP